jgi:hypothetical protein
MQRFEKDDFIDAHRLLRDARSLDPLAPDIRAQLDQAYPLIELCAMAQGHASDSMVEGVWVRLKTRHGVTIDGVIRDMDEANRPKVTLSLVGGGKQGFMRDDVGSVNKLTTTEIDRAFGSVHQKRMASLGRGSARPENAFQVAAWCARFNRWADVIATFRATLPRWPSLNDDLRLVQDPRWARYQVAVRDKDRVNAKLHFVALRKDFPHATEIRRIGKLYDDTGEVFEQLTDQQIADAVVEMEEADKAVGADEPSGKPVGPPTKIETVKPTDPNDPEAIGDAKLAEALQYDEASLPGKPNEAANLQKAIALFKEAKLHFERAMKQKPDRAAEIEKKIVQCNQGVYFCKKRSSL